jgi:hypothetical protein
MIRSLGVACADTVLVSSALADYCNVIQNRAVEAEGPAVATGPHGRRWCLLIDEFELGATVETDGLPCGRWRT